MTPLHLHGTVAGDLQNLETSGSTYKTLTLEREKHRLLDRREEQTLKVQHLSNDLSRHTQEIIAIDKALAELEAE